ncbi:septal ring lytic transglycosylase RlpA family protein [Methylobacterium sp. E-046]|uniref:septal ring lytic transglycosylase RlpA family protein n=1 Tax=Methylobacterium sp. E-046 TaxID=2836576 RepID=UPI001FB9A3EF|nr:septal ring lytic transglycosylase RlpA family protein [Methylobacterium sp. E-046]MCJ2100180.1 septal ring lytic transglycosylase RlpA family protein [Methylobacterium sp. E-046]
MVRTTLSRPARLALRLIAVSGVALATANCATAPQQKLAAAGNGVDPKYGVKASPRLYNEGDVIPKGGGRRYTGKPYVVAGQTYVPKENPSGYVREGLASWYGSAFHGRMTANGEVFDRHSIAAAHPTLPLPSYARVTNLDNGYSMVVRVNDRGPYHAGRVMDVSEEAAEALGFHRQGTARVRVEYAGKASVAGSDDRKLLASLRTDGRPAGRSAVMVADLGPSEETERYARSGPAPLAFKPAQDRVLEREEPVETPASRPERPAPARAPIVLAAAAVSVPAAVQPTAPRVRDFRPAPMQVAAARDTGLKGAGLQGGGAKVAGLNPALTQATPQGHGTAAAGKIVAKATARTAPGLEAAGHTVLAEAARRPVPAPGPAQRATMQPARVQVAQGQPVRTAPAAMPASAKLAMARLAAPASHAAAAAQAGAPKTAGVKAGASKVAASVAGTPARMAAPAGAGHARLAGIY